MKTSVIALLICLLGLSLNAQMDGGTHAPRTEDHFFRRRVLMRIDLQEKQNKPLIPTEQSVQQGGPQKYANRNGLVSAVLKAYENGTLLGYMPDSLDRPVTFSDFINRYKSINSPEPQAEAGKTNIRETFDPEPSDDPDFDPDNEWQESPTEEPSQEPGFENPEALPAGPPVLRSGLTAIQEDEMRYELSAVLEVVEDRIYDKNRSDLYHDLHYVRLIWIDPQGQLMERAMVTFRYEDLQALLDDTQVRNRWNDAEQRSMRETFEQRDFHAFLANVGGNPVLTLQESQQRQQQLTDWEHSLYQY